ncbi:hypothetical protein FM111_02105 [Brevundimonas diminuta 3F5N]|uniref:Uncharacterized protein n=1 Tax=Brevundimonas diminuta 3F5N TaxID=1255603 RepID=A0A1R4F1S7_BREDI|nr:hypothetical protein [Brevundimonas diminuta]SJM49879.1 hypothetical protein FM111_02105 [Brevundimonas diminuta 3F5N]
MSGVKHTPVELHAVFNGLYWDVAVGPHDYSQRVASCHANHVLGHGLEDAERHARLFAAAPDLLKAGQNVVEEWGMRTGDDDALLPSSEQPESIAALMRAIARARGEQDGGGE